MLVDAPPCLEFADARNMALYADGLVLVVTGELYAAVRRLKPPYSGWTAMTFGSPGRPQPLGPVAQQSVRFIPPAVRQGIS